jgi:hypothetical protein
MVRYSNEHRGNGAPPVGRACNAGWPVNVGHHRRLVSITLFLRKAVVQEVVKVSRFRSIDKRSSESIPDLPGGNDVQSRYVVHNPTQVGRLRSQLVSQP